MSKRRQGYLEPAKAEELRQILSDENTAKQIVEAFARSMSSEMEPDWRRELFIKILSRQYGTSVERIFKYVESPIEKIFFASFMCSCLKNGMIVEVEGPPAGDFPAVVAERTKHCEDLFRCYSFYKALPDDARPKEFRGFLEVAGVEPGGLTPEQADWYNTEATVLFLLNVVHAIHVTLQPTFENFNGTRSARPDAVLWIPSDPTFRIVVECDGFETHGDRDAFDKDRKRDRRFQEIGYIVRRYSGSEIHHQPIQSSADLAGYLVDQKRTSLQNEAWEQRIKNSDGAKPEAAVIDGWREWMAADRDEEPPNG